MFLTMLMAKYGFSQSKSINEVFLSVNFENDMLSDIFSDIEGKTDFHFVFDMIKVQEKSNKFTLDSKNEPLASLLRNLSQLTDLKFKRVNEMIHVARLDREDSGVEEIITNIADLDVSGKVTDDTGIGLSGVNVLVKGTTQGVVADLDGNYKINVAENATLIFSYVGYATHELEVNGRNEISVNLTAGAEYLEELVVIGYGAVKKSDVTGSVASVSSEALTAYTAIDAIQALQGRAAGVSVQSTNGEPGSGYKIQIRGSTSINANSGPLIVVDDFAGGVMPPPEDIQSMEILKDASATAIYGSRGANGVIMVTTKRGQSRTTKLNFSSSWSSQKEVNRLDLLNGSEFAGYINEIDPGFYANPSSYGKGTDWQDELYREGGIQNYQLSISGGSDAVTYYLSGSVFDQKGIVKDSYYKRYSVSSNVNIKATDKISVGANLFARRVKRNGTRTQEGGDAAQTGVISGAYKFMPTQGLTDANGDYSIVERGFPIDNPFAMATELDNVGAFFVK
ncbi:MAG: TonB-linked SusC/RagA family outer membrane protein [Cyclobacteriaceae bacterium]|jgi:TonB-linked SusC/RagA family outer membrane protein